MAGQIDPFWIAGAQHLMGVLTALLSARGEEVTIQNVLRLLDAHPTLASLNEIAEFTSDDARERLRILMSDNAGESGHSFIRMIQAVLSPMDEGRRL